MLIMACMDEMGTPLDWDFEPLQLLRRFPTDTPLLMLHSGRYDARWAKQTIISSPVGWYRFIVEDGARDLGRGQWIDHGRPCPAVQPLGHRPLRNLRNLLAGAEGGLWIGYFSYDIARWIERLPHHAVDDRNWPVIELAWCPGWLSYDLEAGRWCACGEWQEGGRPELLDRPVDLVAPPAAEPRPYWTRQQYERAAERVLDYIAAGDVFQVNLAQRFTADLDAGVGDLVPARALFASLAQVSPAWYGALLELPSDPAAPHRRRALASTSPELFLQHRNRQVLTRPIKGTLAAAADPALLERSEKDAAELNMIVDLLRNDLGRVCDYGSVKVVQPRTIESHPTIHHAVASIAGRLHSSRTLVDLLRATLPGGSITGAPKVRAMQIIDELEPVRRGPYCGSIGMLAGDDCTLNIAIRTMMLEWDARHGGGRADFSVGGGIVADSTAEAEYAETLDKATAMRQALGWPAAERVDS